MVQKMDFRNQRFSFYSSSSLLFSVSFICLPSRIGGSLILLRSLIFFYQFFCFFDFVRINQKNDYFYFFSDFGKKFQEFFLAYKILQLKN